MADIYFAAAPETSQRPQPEETPSVLCLGPCNFGQHAVTRGGELGQYLKIGQHNARVSLQVISSCHGLFLSKLIHPERYNRRADWVMKLQAKRWISIRKRLSAVRREMIRTTRQARLVIGSPRVESLKSSNVVGNSTPSGGNC